MARRRRPCSAVTEPPGSAPAGTQAGRYLLGPGWKLAIIASKMGLSLAQLGSAAWMEIWYSTFPENKKYMVEVTGTPLFAKE